MTDRYPIVLRMLSTDWVPEYKFHPTRRWSFDYAHPVAKIAIEVDGGTWSGGRHTTGAGFAKDCEKFNEAAKLGWRVLRFLPGQIRSGAFLPVVKDCLRGEP